VHFTPWFPLAESVEQAPEAPGVIQLRAAEIFPYPRGLSAMVLYACSDQTETARAFIAGRGRSLLTHAGEHGAILIRFGEAAQPERELLRLLASFKARFGTLPVANASQGCIAERPDQDIANQKP